MERLERKVFWNSYVFLGISLLYAAWCGLNGIGLGGSRVPYEDRHWLMADATWLKGGIFPICFFLARRRPHARGFGIGLHTSLLRLGLPDHFIDHGDSALLLTEAGLDDTGIINSVTARLGAGR